MGTSQPSDDYYDHGSYDQDVILLHSSDRDDLHQPQIRSLAINSHSRDDHPLPHKHAITATPTSSTTATTTTTTTTTDQLATAVINIDQLPRGVAHPQEDEYLYCTSKLYTGSCHIRHFVADDPCASHIRTDLPVDQYQLPPPLRKLRTSAAAPIATTPMINAVGCSFTTSNNPIGVTHHQLHPPACIESAACDASSSCSNKSPQEDLPHSYHQSMCSEGLIKELDCNGTRMKEEGSITVISKLRINGDDCANSNDVAASGKCVEMQEAGEQSCETPKARENMIPAAEVCPPAPKKKKAAFYKSYKRRLRSNYHPYAHQDQSSSSSSPSPSPPSSPTPPSFGINCSTVPNLHLPPQPRFFIPPDLHSLPESIQSLFK